MRRRDIEEEVKKRIRLPKAKDRILVVIDELSKDIESSFGILLPPWVAKKDKCCVGTVVAVTDDIKTLKVGDRVLQQRIMGTPIYVDFLDGCLLRMVDHSQLEAIVSGNDRDDYDYYADGLTLKDSVG